MIYITADWHLTDRMWVGQPRLDGDSYVMLKRLVKAIIEDAVPAGQNKTLIVAGDVTDSNAINGRCTIELVNAMQELAQNAINVVFIQGNHDRGAVHHLTVAGAIQLQPDDIYDIDGWAVTGLSYLPRTRLQEAVRTLPAVDILVMHCAFQHLLGFEGAYDLTVEDLPLTVGNVIVGDVHKREILSPRDRTGWVLSPGALQACDVGQGSDHGFWRLAPKCENAYPVYVPLPHRSIYRFQFGLDEPLKDLQDSFDEVVASAPQPDGQLPIIELKYEPERVAEVEPLLQMYQERLVLMASGQRMGSLVDKPSPDAHAMYEKITLRAALDLRLKPEEDKEVYDLLADTLSNPEQAKEIIEKYREAAIA